MANTIIVENGKLKNKLKEYLFFRLKLLPTKEKTKFYQLIKRGVSFFFNQGTNDFNHSN